jgi:sugar/nucleoside kinase (ribokinase family)
MDAAIFGLLVADIVVSPLDLRHPPDPGGLHQVKTLELTTGGNAASVAIAMAKLGMRVAAAGLVGRDVLGTAVTQRLRDARVDTEHVLATDAAPTCATIVAVEPGGERCFFHLAGSTAKIDAAVLRRCFPLFARSTFTQIGYFGLLPGLTADLPGLLPELRAAAPRTRLALDTVTPPAARKLLDPILPHLDIFCPSRNEAQTLTSQSDPARMVADFRKLMPRGLIGIKLDAQGCYLDDGEQQVLAPAYRINCIDTTGAGDVWYAGLLTGLAKGMPLVQCARLANRAAADCCTALGASAGVRSFEETLARL